MPTTTDASQHSQQDDPGHDQHSVVVAYYRTVAATLLRHLAGRPVVGRGAGPVGPRDGVALHIDDAADLDEAVRSGVVSFLLADSPDRNRLGLRIRAGEDSGLDTVATAALALMELMEADGVHVTALLDGAGGLYLAGIGAHQPAALRYANDLADRSPEIATTRDTDTSGRALIEPLSSGADGMPAPYSLVEGPGGLAVITPLTRDEVAAATAGMPLDIEMADVPGRLRTHGDLARRLTDESGADA